MYLVFRINECEIPSLFQKWFEKRCELSDCKIEISAEFIIIDWIEFKLINWNEFNIVLYGYIIIDS